MALAAVAALVLPSLLGHHNDYPNGNPANLSKFDAMATAAAAGDATNLQGLRLVSQGAQVNMGPYAGGWGSNFVVNWGEATAGRAAERAYATRLYNALALNLSTSSNPVAPVTAGIAVAGPANQPDAITRAMQRAAAAGIAELSTSGAQQLTAQAQAANAAQRSLTTSPPIGVSQQTGVIAIGLVLLVLLFLLLRK